MLLEIGKTTSFYQKWFRGGEFEYEYEHDHESLQESYTKFEIFPGDVYRDQDKLFDEQNGGNKNHMTLFL